MAEYCEKCIKECLGLEPNDENYEAWLVGNECICEGCGYDYLDAQDNKNGCGKRLDYPDINCGEVFMDKIRYCDECVKQRRDGK
jgi:hypothetical protein